MVQPTAVAATGRFRAYAPHPSGHCRALDGIRGLAILMVFLFDCMRLPADGALWSRAARSLCSTGWTGVDLFFVLSGFLITGILLDTRGTRGYFVSFFGRRALRIFPLYYAVLLSVFGLLPRLAHVLAPGGQLATRLAALGEDQLWYWVYLQNWLHVSRGVWPETPYLNHFWSLAIEEQFYLVWPFVVAALSRQRLLQVSLLACALALALRCWLQQQGVGEVVLHVATLTRMDSLCCGAIVAILIRDPAWYPRLTRWALPVCCGTGLLLCGLHSWRPILEQGSPLSQTAGYSLLGLLFAMFVAWGASLHPETRVARLIGLPPLTVLGQYSYALYVLHRPVYAGIKLVPWGISAGAGLAVVHFVATLAVSFVVACVSWRLLEQPFLALKRYFPRPTSPEAASLEAGAAVAPPRPA